MGVEAPAGLKRILFRDRGGLSPLRFLEDRWLTALVPDQERFGLARELVLQRIYDSSGAQLSACRTVVDAGANVGLFSLVASRYVERVIALEPDPINHRLLELNLFANAADNVTTIEAALWTEDGEVEFARPPHEVQRPWSSTGAYVVTPLMHGNGRLTKAVSLESVVERYGDIDLLKMDIEGAEEEVLVATSALGHVKRMIAELHLSRPGQERPIIIALREQGFSVRLLTAASLYTPGWVPRVLRNWGRLDGELLTKVGLLVYLLAPITKPRRSGRDMPLLIATR